MKPLIAVLVPVFWGAAASGAEEPRGFAGEWKTTMGPVTFEQNGNDVTGRIVFYRLPLKGTIKDKALKVGYDEGRTHVDATLALEASGNAFTGTFQASNGNRGVWNGWRPDTAASRGAAADFSGVWLTDLGLMELTRDGSRVKGRYALRGTSTLEGDVKGRHLDFHVKAIRTGPGWFDLDSTGKNIAGAGGTDGMPGWYGWNGRKAPEYVRHAPLAAGKIVDGSTSGLLTYSVRAPEGHKPGDKTKWPSIVVLHGSNMNGNAYVNTVAAAWPDIARDYILLGINGETPSNLAADGPAFNYTYVNYMGRSTYQGYPGTDRESPALVREALEDLMGVYPIKHYFVGGHSQGGYLTYSVLMNSPEAIRGAFPISAMLLMQCEPSVFADAALKAEQRGVPLAIVHGKNDPMVSFDGGSYAYRDFLDAGWPAIRLFDHATAGHMFALLPVGPAIRWLEVMNSDNPTVLLEFADKRLKERGYRDAIAAGRRARGLSLDAKAKARLDKLAKTINDAAAPKARTYLKDIRAAQGNSWVDGFLAYRDEFEFADAAAGAMTAFNELRAKQEEPAAKLMGEARGMFQQGRRDDGYARAKEVVDTYYASPSYRVAKMWLAERK
jgi:predicted esterase